jgi:hypothetical protein
MSSPPGPLAIDAGLLNRYRDAGRKIAWRPAPKTPKVPKRPAGHRARIAHLNDEEARVEEWGTDSNAGLAVDSGPVGALVILLEIDRRGPASAVGAKDAGRDAAFPGGAIVAAWGDESVPTDSQPRMKDLIELARYALA